MKSLVSFLLLMFFVTTGFAITVTVNASSTGTVTSTTKTSGTIVVNNGINRGYAVFNLASAGIPAGASITSVKLIFTYTVTGSGTPTRTVYGYVGDISSLAAGSLYSGSVTSNTLYTASWGNTSTTKTMATTAAADTFIQRNRANTVSVAWVESGSGNRYYSITGGTSPKLQIVYTCTTPTAVSISASANPICSGSSETLTGAATGGVTYSWSGPNGFTSTLRNPTAFTTSTASAGTYTFTATSACNVSTSATLTLAVKTVPGTTTGSSSVCTSSTATLSNAGLGGTWSSSSNSTATVNSATGVVTGVAAGSVNITYATACGSNAVFPVTVIAPPAAIGGASVVCQGATTTLTNTVSGGSWTSANASIASVSTSGVVTGISAGTVNISYTNSCGTQVKSITVGIGPSAISGASSVCAGASTTLTNSVTGGTWSSSSAARATVDPASGVVTGVAAGAVTITYSTGCGTNTTLSITVNASPNAISGATSVCTGASTTLTDATTAGTWSSSNTARATVSSGGVVTGISEGAVTISYTKAGCSALSAFSVKIVPSAISGTSALCSGTTTTLGNTSLFGIWSSSATGVASVNTAGIVTAVAAGTATITYSTGCGTAATKTMTISTTPAAISAASTVCTGATSTFTSATNGGTWTSSNSSIASVTTGGVVRGNVQGSATITYAIGSCLTTAPVLVKTAPAAISGITAICNGSVSALSNTSLNGTWSTSNASIASINTSGLVTSIAQGSATITYTTGCGTDATTTINVGLAPTAISGNATMCTNATNALTEAVAGGTWSSSNTAVATVSNSGVVTGLTAGSASISYTLTNGCGTNIVSKAVAVSQTGLWLGSSSEDWNDAANWPCGTIPDSTIDVVIPAGTTFLPDFSAATFYTRSLTISSNATISISGDATMEVHGNLTNNGVANGDGAIVMKSSAAQFIYGKGTVYNLEINNTHGVTIRVGDSVKVVADLTLTAGIFTTNNGLKLVSNSLGTARIAPVTGGSIVGNVNIEQYFEGGRRAFRFFAHPFSTSIPLSMIGANLDVTGNGGTSNGFTQTASNAASCFRYNPLVGNSTIAYDPGWRPFTSANSTTDTNAFIKHQGVRLFVRGAKDEGLGYGAYTPSAVTIRMAGPVNTGTQVITLKKGSNSDYNQVGNPYPSPTDIGTAINNAKVAGQVTGSAFYVWNPFLGAAGAFEPKLIGAAYVLDQNSSFQVRATTNGATLTFTENNKATNGDETLLRSAASPYITLGVYDANNHAWDKMYLSFNGDATSNEDAQYDATKAINPDLNFYSLAGDTKLSVDARPYTNNTVIPVGFTANYAQQYTIKAENMALPAGATLYLHDKMLNQYVQLQSGTEYSFDITADKATQGENRFELTANNGVVAQNNFSVTMTPNPATDNATISYSTDANAATTLRVMNITGATVISKALGNDTNGKVVVSLNGLPTGVYMVEVISGNNKNVQKLIKE